MLSIIPVRSYRDKIDYLESFSPFEQTWILSDLKSKVELQKILLKKFPGIPDESILRASEYWRLLYGRVERGLSYVSDSFFQTLLRQIIEEYAAELGIHPSSERTLFRYLKTLAPVLFHPEGVNSLEEWFQSHPQASVQWRAWFLRARFCAKLLIDKHQVMIRDWTIHFLLAQVSSAGTGANQLNSLKWNRSLIVDLNADMTRSEAEMFRHISRNTNVVVFAPELKNREQFKYILNPYEFLESESSGGPKKITKGILPQDEKISSGGLKSTEVLRLASALGEVKFAVARIRQWINQGISPHKILVVAPAMNDYWPSLRAHLEFENILVTKDLSTNFQSLAEVHRWLAKIRIFSRRPNAEDLEVGYFKSFESSENRILYEKFKSLYKNIYDRMDLARSEEVKEDLNDTGLKIKPSQLLNREKFLGFMIATWRNSENSVFTTLMSDFVRNSIPSVELSFSEWFLFMEKTVQQRQKLILEGFSGENKEGLNISSLDSLPWARDFSHRIFLGLDEDSLKMGTQAPIESRDVLSISSLFGFYLEDPEQSVLDFELNWLGEQEAKESLFLFSQTDFSGNLRGVSRYWLQKLQQSGDLNDFEKVTNPELTVFDLAQRNSKLKATSEGLRRDAQLLSPELLPQDHLRFSASAMDRYFECPFLYAAERIFRLKTFPEIELDLDAMTRGHLIHALFYFLTDPNGTQDDRSYSEQKASAIDDFLETYRLEKLKGQGVFMGDDRLWPSTKSKLKKVAERFLKHESAQRAEFPEARIVAREMPFNVQFSDKIVLSGRIDRIDGDMKGHLAVVDYKSSHSEWHLSTKWIERKKLQLLMYGYLIEKYQILEGQGLQRDSKIAGLYYLSAKDFTRKGLGVIGDIEKICNPPRKRKNSNNGREDLEKLYQDFEDLLNGSSSSIFEGHFEPKPLKSETCIDCEYKKLCRVNHSI